MSDLLYNAINGGLEVVLICLFFQTFVQPIAWQGRKWTLGCIGCLFVGLLAIPKPAPVNFVLILLLIFFISMLYKMKWYQHIFFSVIIVTLYSLSEVIVVVISSMILNVELALLKTGNYLLFGMLASKLIILIMILILKFGRHKLPLKHLGSVWGYVIFVLVTSIVSIFLVLDYMHLILGNTTKQFVTLLAVSLIIVMNIMLFYIIDKINEHFETKHNLDTAKELIESQKATYKTLYENQQEIRKVRHDLKNSMVGILYELENKKTEDAISRVKGILKLLEEQRFSFSGNSIIDTLMNFKKKEAATYNIQWEESIHLSESLNIDPIDFSVLLGNALDNAIEATAKQTTHPKTIFVSIAYKQENLLMVIKNPVDCLIDTTNLESTKQNKNHHGFGILQMKQLAQKYNGEVFLECTNEQFKTSILIGKI